MIFELMSNGNLAELPFAGGKFPDAGGIPLPSGPFVMLLLPHNRYILGRPHENNECWVWGKFGEPSHNIYLYDGERLSLPESGAPTVAISGDTVSLLRKKLLSQMEPPGEHQSTVLLLRSLMKDHPVFSNGFPFLDEHAFTRMMRDDKILYGAYWALRLATARGEFDEMVRLRAWLKVSNLFTAAVAGPCAKLWFSILDLPDDTAIRELAELAFSREDLCHMAAQRVSPLLMFNPQSGYLILARFGRNVSGSEPSSNFFVWAFLPAALWGELRERRKLSVHEILLAVWGQYDVEKAAAERRLYAPTDCIDEECCRAEPVAILRA